MSKSARAATDTDGDDDDELEVGPRYGFSPKQIQEFKAVFKEFDVNGQPTPHAKRARLSVRLLTLSWHQATAMRMRMRFRRFSRGSTCPGTSLTS